MKSVFLFDIDGVLVQPRGYQVSVREACAFFARQLGYNDCGDLPEIFEMFESNGITSEFDMLPLWILNLLEVSLEMYPENFLSGRLADYTDLFSGLSCPDNSIRFLVETLGKSIRPGEYPSQAALRLFRAGNLFPRLEGAQVVEELLEYSRSVSDSIAAQVFQNLVLGDQLFEKTYQMPARFIRKSALTQNDIALLAVRHAEQLLDLWRREILDVALMTLRPSCPPKEVRETITGYSPEAELGVKMVGLEELPLVGFGQLEFCASQIGMPVEMFAKPAKGHALAALSAALFREEMMPIELALGYEVGRISKNYLWNESPLTVHVFEDSSSGIISAQAAVSQLIKMGLEIDLKIWGIGEQPLKLSSLKRLGAQIFPNITQALDCVIAML